MGVLECMEYKADGSLRIEDLKNGAHLHGDMLIASSKFERLAKTIARVAPYQSTVLIHGESGTGKDVVARALHRLGPTPNGPFVIFNCSNLVDTLAESQLFGHVRGAFTDAREDSIGYFRAADGGTLFLDEIGELPPALQPKLLRAVESHEVQPVGSAKAFGVKLRLLAATNRDLSAMVADGSFRADLYYRVNATALSLPPLREQREALSSFIAYFVEQHNRHLGKQVTSISSEAFRALIDYEWPGNFRELRHVIEGAVMLAEKDRIEIELLPESMRNDSADSPAPEPAHRIPGAPAEAPAAINGSYSLDNAIQVALVRALRKANGSCHVAAKLLGVSRYTVYRMMTRYGLGQLRDYRSVLNDLAPPSRDTA